MDNTTDTNESLFCTAFRLVLSRMASNRGAIIDHVVADVVGERADKAWIVGAHAAEGALLGWDESYRVGRDFGVTRELAAKLWEESIEAARAWLGAPAAVA